MSRTIRDALQSILEISQDEKRGTLAGFNRAASPVGAASAWGGEAQPAEAATDSAQADIDLIANLVRQHGDKHICERWQALVEKLGQPAEPVADDALAALDWNRLRDGATRALDPANQWAFDKLLAQPAEPVGGVVGLQAITNEDDGYLTLRFSDEDAALAFMRAWSDAAPPAPQPAGRALTDEQIDHIRSRQECWEHVGERIEFRHLPFARAIERAHGIGAARTGSDSA